MTLESPASASASSASSSSSVNAKATGRFLGWQVLGVAFLTQILSNGISLSAFSNFMTPLSQEFDVPLGTIAYGSAIAIACMGLVSPFVGRAFDRSRAREAMTFGMVLAAAGLYLLSRAERLETAAISFVMICVGAALFGPLPAMTLVANWFDRRRGFAIGIAYAGATLVSYLGPAAAQYFIDTADWRSAIRFFGAIVLFVGLPAVALFTVGRPEDVGQLPDGESAPLVQPEPLPVKPVGEIVRDPRLWLISLGFGLILTSPIVLLTLLVPYGVQLGFTGQETNRFFAAMVPFSLFGKLVLGRLADTMPARPILAFIVIFNVLTWASLYSVPSYAQFLLTGAIYGLGIGGAAPVHGVILGRCIDRGSFGTASGIGGILAVMLLFSASLMSGYLQGDGEGYPTVFKVQMGLITLGGFLLAFVRVPSAAEHFGD